MADDSSKGNVIKGPWRKVKNVKKSQTEKVALDMQFIDDIAESVMIPMIHGLAENGLDIKDDKFIAAFGFINETVRALMFKHLGYKHEMNRFIDLTMTLQTEKTEDLYASFNHDLVEKMSDTMKKELEKDKKDD